MHAVPIRLCAREHRLRRLGDQVVEIGFRAGKLRCRIGPGAGGDGEAGALVHDFAGDMGLMAQKLAQIVVDVADGNTGFGDFHFDVVTPIVGETAGRAVGVGLALKRGQIVEHASGDHLASQTARGKIWRNGKSLDHQAIVMRGIPHRIGQQRDDAQQYKRDGKFERQSQKAAQMAHQQRPMAQIQFVGEFLSLKLDKFSLVIEKRIRFPSAGPGQSQRYSCRISARAVAFRARSDPFGFLRHPGPQSLMN